MSAEAGLAATAAVDASESQSTAAFNQAIQAHQQVTLAQNFESSINEAAQSLQTGAAACQQADLTCKKAAIQHNEPSSQSIPEMRVWPQDQSSGLGAQVTAFVDQFSQRAKNLSGEIDSIVNKIEGPTSHPAATTSASALAPEFHITDALKLMENTFEFAVEASLISNASSLSTRIFNELLREQ
jgi:hypothetical protein